jgi:hypothetical protein
MGVPRYFVPYTNDCFQNAYGSVISYLGLKPDLLLSDYLSFVYSPETGFAGMNYLHKESSSVEFTEEELNISQEYIYYPATTYYSRRGEKDTKEISNDKIKITWYIDDDNNNAYSRMKELIDKDLPVVAVVDLYYIRYHKAYHKEHGLHAIVITGYNEEENYVELFDKYKFSNCDFDGRLPIDEVIKARSSKNCSDKITRPIRNLWMEFDGDKQFVYSEKRWIGVIEESCRRMHGEKELLGCKCGFESIEALRADLLERKKRSTDEKFNDLFRNYYSAVFRGLSRGRTRFAAFLTALDSELPEDLACKTTDLLKQSAKAWEICANLSIRLAITKNMNGFDNISEQLIDICNYEGKVVEMLHKFICEMKREA